MAGLTDMEELLARVQNAQVSDYLREALRCYGAGAYRACIVLTFIAVFDDLRLKARALGQTSAEAKTISAEIEALADGQKPFESTLVDRLQAKKLLTELQAQQLKKIIYHRNKAAHPSGSVASAEEARFVYFEAIDSFLSKPVLSTVHGADIILAELLNKNYFPQALIGHISHAVKSALSSLHPDGYIYLVTKLVERAGVGSTTDHQARNARWFLLGMARAGDDQIDQILYDKLIKPKCIDLNYTSAITSVVCGNHKVLYLCDDLIQERLLSLFIARNQAQTTESPVNTTHSISVLASILKGDPDKVFPAYATFFQSVLEKYWASPAFLDAIKGSTQAVHLTVDFLHKKAGSTEFSIANRFSLASSAVDKLAPETKPDAAFRVLASVVRAAEVGAYEATALSSGKFHRMPKFRAIARAFAADDPDAAKTILQSLGLSYDAEEFVAKYLPEAESGEADDPDDEIPF